MPIQLPPIDDEVYAALQEKAVPLEDDINSVLRRLLGLAVQRPVARKSAAPSKSSNRQRQARGRTKRTRAPKGSVLPEAEYEVPILRALDLVGGRGPTSEVIGHLEKELGPKLTPLDRAKLTSGDVRWKNRAQFVRLKLVENGEMVAGSPRGTWEISELGRKRLKAEG